MKLTGATGHMPAPTDSASHPCAHLAQHATAWANIFLPLHYCTFPHYALIHVHMPTRTMTLYDSWLQGGARSQQHALRRADALLARLQHGATDQTPPPLRHVVRQDMPQQQDGTSCGVFMACTALAILRALRDGGDPLNPTLDFEHKHMNWLRVHFAHRYCNRVRPLRDA